MRVEFRPEPGCGEPYLMLVAEERSGETDALMAKLSGLGAGPLPGRRGGEARLRGPEEVLRFYGGTKEVFAHCADGSEWQLRERLYELEERFCPGGAFLRISNSEIVNVKRVTGLDLSLAGTIRMTLDGEVVCYVSRRYVKKIKKALGI